MSEVQEISPEEAKLQRQLTQMRRNHEWEKWKSRLLNEMCRHMGQDKAIGMRRLAQIVFQAPVDDAYNDTAGRNLRKLIEEAQWGDPDSAPLIICSCPAGYYLPVGQEALDYIEQRLIAPALKKLKRAARLKRETYKELVGRLALEG